jgi:hypothetical protein
MNIELELITRDGCLNTPAMITRLGQALRALGLDLACSIVDRASLAQTDPRVGYPTPTVLVGNSDLFGMAEPVRPFAGAS